MKFVKDILFELDLLVPPRLALPGDNVGLLVGDLTTPVTACVMALDVTNDVIELAKRQKAEVIITHHPVIYEPLSSINRNSIVHKLIRNNISVICSHSQLDVADGGVNSVFASLLGLTQVKVLKGTDGMARVGRLKSDLTGTDLARYTKTMMCAPSAQVVNGHNIVSYVAVMGGSGGRYVESVLSTGVDAFITGDVKHSNYIEAINSGKTLITIGHNYSEVQVLNTLKAKLKTVLNEVVFLVEEKYPVVEI